MKVLRLQGKSTLAKRRKRGAHEIENDAAEGRRSRTPERERERERERAAPRSRSRQRDRRRRKSSQARSPVEGRRTSQSNSRRAKGESPDPPRKVTITPRIIAIPSVRPHQRTRRAIPPPPKPLARMVARCHDSRAKATPIVVVNAPGSTEPREPLLPLQPAGSRSRGLSSSVLACPKSLRWSMLLARDATGVVTVFRSRTVLRSRCASPPNSNCRLTPPIRPLKTPCSGSGSLSFSSFCPF